MLAVAATGAGLAPAGRAVHAEAGRPSTDDVVDVRGDYAVEALLETGAAPAVARRAGVSVADVLEHLDEDPAAFVDLGGGGLGYAEPLPPQATEPAAGPPGPEPPTGIPDAQVRSLHSRPGSSRVVYLDVDGHQTTGTPWNANATPGPSFWSGPYDVDGDPTSMSSLELQRVARIWMSVAEDFAPFDVDVTTQDPGVDALRRTGSGDSSYGIRVVISSTDWMAAATGMLTGGVAYVGSFTWSTDTPAFVFAGNLGSGSYRSVAEATAHEAGHAFGLLHDGVSGVATYATGTADWAPIMGASYYGAVTQWSRGEYPGASNREDDVARLGAVGGWTPDDHPGDATGATPLVVGSTVAGLIGAGGDVDVFRVTVGNGRLRVTVVPTGAPTDLHARVEVLRTDGSVVASAAPDRPTGWRAEAGAAVPAGTYHVVVRGTGWRDASSGFSAYASMGAYALTVEGGTPQAPPPPPAPTAAAPVRLTPVAPERVLDTRSGLGGAARLGAGDVARVQVTGAAGVPAGAAAAVVTVTAVSPRREGFLTAYGCGAVPGTSSVNHARGRDIANTVIVPLDASGALCVYADAEADVLVDVTGWLGAGASSALTPRDPVRVVDTRSGAGGATRLHAGATVEVDVRGVVAPGATAVAFNLTAVGASAPGFLTAFPCGTAVPTTSTVNYAEGEARPGNGIVALGDGRLCVTASSDVDVLVDVTGSLGASGLAYLPATPTRILDTRHGRPVEEHAVVAYDVPVAPGGAWAVAAASVNVTAVDHGRAGFTTSFDCRDRADTSTVNQIPGEADANGAVVVLDAGTRSCLYTDSGGHLVADLAGWWVRP